MALRKLVELDAGCTRERDQLEASIWEALALDTVESDICGSDIEVED